MTAYLVYLLTMAGIYGVMSLSLSLQYGQTGLVNLGQVGFFMVGAYASAICSVLFGWPIAAAFLVGILAGALFGVLMALPIGDLRQDYWAIVTIAAAELARVVFLNTNLGDDYTGGSYGLTGIPSPMQDVLSGGAFDLFYLGLVLASVLVCYLLVAWVSRSPYGRVLKAVRESDEVAQALGKDVRVARIWAMAIGGAVAGLGGALFAHFIGFIDPTYFLPLETFLIWAMVILGGPGNHLGALAGAVIIQAIYNSTRFIGFGDEYSGLVASLRMVLIGVLIIVVILYLPRGLIPERRRRYGAGHAAER
ncbi:branched-chain amino acid ABC transporter permease [Arhodomonas sp. SL1]|uniref:branched-chain amino acid ABC transporter permease n=1 Tax=Arhodomonas sp. SL1 TaxID=3425691 RepID=UPI003F885176